MARKKKVILERFQGFEYPKTKWFKVPNEWTNITANIDSLAELKVIEYVMRHTWGFGEYNKLKKITIDEFMKGRMRRNKKRMDNGTGMSEFGVKDGLKRAITHGYLVFYIDDRDKGRIVKYYGLNMCGAKYELDDEEAD